MGQSICKRCGNAYHYSDFGHQSFDHLTGNGYCDSCSEYRSAALTKAEASFDSDFQYNRAKIKCPHCNGKGHVGENEMTCEYCHGARKVRPDNPTHYKPYQAFQSHIDSVVDEIKIKLPSDFDKKW